MNTKQLPLVTYEQAKRLKALGFDLETQSYYSTFNTEKETLENAGFIGKWNTGPGSHKMTTAPTVALALKWIRDEKDMYNSVNFFDVITPEYMGLYQVNHVTNVGSKRLYPRTTCETQPVNTYEAAESALLDELLTILEEEKKQ
jgi:hypothetical protein